MGAQSEKLELARSYTVRWGKSSYRASSGFPPGNNLERAGAVRPWLSFMCKSCFGVLFCNHMRMLVKRSKHFVPTQRRWLSQLIQGRRQAGALAMPGSSNIIILWYKDTNGKKPRPNAQRILSATKGYLHSSSEFLMLLKCSRAVEPFWRRGSLALFWCALENLAS